MTINAQMNDLVLCEPNTALGFASFCAEMNVSAPSANRTEERFQDDSFGEGYKVPVGRFSPCLWG